MNAMQRAMRALHATVTQTAGVGATYDKDGDKLDLVVVPADVDAEIIGDNGFPVRIRAVDFLIACDKLVFKGVLVEPEAGDRIDVRRSLRMETYEITRLGGRACCEPADPYGNAWRVHTLRIKQ